MTLKPCVIILEANIGAGKTTLARAAVHHWESIYGYGKRAHAYFERVNQQFLQAFIDNKKYAFAFQLDMSVKRIETMRDAYKTAARGDVVIVDRGMVGDGAFASVHRNEGNINDEDWAIYQSVMKEHPGPQNSLFSEKEHICNIAESWTCPDPPVVIVYLKTSVKKAMERIAKRSIAAEVNGYDEAYIQALSDSHDRAIDAVRAEMPVVDIDNDVDCIGMDDGILSKETVKKIFDKVFEKIN